MPRVEMRFPLKGINKNWANSEQPPITSPHCNNVRPTDVSETRTRGGQRPGLDKWGAGTQIGGVDSPVVAMCTVHTVTD
jgi:hypothetical protein